MLLQTMTGLKVDVYCRGESGAQPTSGEDCSARRARLEVTVSSNIHPVIEHLTIMPRGSSSFFFFFLLQLMPPV